MALYSFGRVKVLSRNGIKSAVATAAYHAGTMLENQYDGVTHDYSDKQNVGETYIRMPVGAPAAWRDESIPAKERLGLIWNAVELASPAQNARLARTNYLALQREFTLEQNLECVDRWIKLNCTDVGMGATYTLHLKEGNPHVDVMYLVNEYGADGKPKFKSKKEYLCRNSSGEELYLDAAAFKASAAEGWQKVYKYQKDGCRKDMTPSEAAASDGWDRVNKHPVCRTVKVGGWDDPDLAKRWRESWASVLNEKFEELGFDVRVDHRSYKERGLLKLATKHEGWGPERAKNQEENAAIRELNQELEILLDDANEVIADVQDQIDDLQQYPQTPETLAIHKQDYQRNRKVLIELSDSNLLGDTLAETLRSIVAELHAIITGLLQRWKEKLFGMEKSADELIKDAGERSGVISEGAPARELEKISDNEQK